MRTNTNPITPALFLSHGSPMSAIEKNSYTADLKKIGHELKNIDAILVISAHWETNGVYVTSAETLSTYHDFRGFPQALFAVEYPVKSALNLIPEIEKLIGEKVQTDNQRGLDHGAWSMLVHLFPEKNIPILQMSLDRTKSFQEHFELAQKLLPLREKNVLILASGNLTHNLSTVNFHNPNAAPSAPSLAFDELVKLAFIKNDAKALIDVEKNIELFKINHPSSDHYIPLLYLMGVRTESDIVEFPHMSWQFGNLSMRHILLN